MDSKKHDIQKELYIISTSHLDTVWSWDLEQDIREYLPQTFSENFDMMDEFPEYKFNFEGAYRYQLLKEYYPEMFEQLKKYTANGQWNVAGSALENGDVNVPSPEALFRNVLYGNNYFDEHFGQRSRDIYLPDCFGFGYALPSIISHANLQGFVTQKLHWGAALENEKLPYDIGLWKGPDGNCAIGDINLNDYTETFENGFRSNDGLQKRLENAPTGAASVLYGSAGDRGGTVPKCTVKKLMEERKANPDSEIKVHISRVDDLVKKLYADPSGLDTYDGEFLMHTHGTGSYSSQALCKRWNRKAELLGYAAEQAGVTADYLGGNKYPVSEFETYWTRVIAHQFHDDITGTSNAQTYVRSRNDYMISIKQFAEMYKSGAASVISGMNTETDGQAVVVHNPLAFAQTGVVRGAISGEYSDGVCVTDANGEPVASQILSCENGKTELIFTADMPALGYKVYTVKADADNSVSALTVTENSLSNERYDVSIDANGDIAGIYDKQIGKQLLASPIRLALYDAGDCFWAAWEVRMEDYNAPEAGFVGGTPAVKIVENGPVRVALEITRTYGGSTFVQTVSLSRGGKAVEVENKVDWREKASILKGVFNFTAANAEATYDLGLGAIRRGNNTSYKAEVPMQRWADITDKDGGYGVSILNDCKYGIDKPNDSTLRMTLIHTPLNNFTHSPSYGPSGQDQQELGENRFAFAVCGHENEVGGSGVQQLAEAFNQPMAMFSAESHAGELGKEYSFGNISNDKVIVRAIKKAEKSDEIIVRVNEIGGEGQTGVTLTLGGGIVSARETYASEETVGTALVADGKLCFDIGKYGVKTFALTLKSADTTVAAVKQTAVELPYNVNAYSCNDNRAVGGFNRLGETYPAELVPGTVSFGGIDYPLGDKNSEKNAVVCAGQTISVPDNCKLLHILAVSTDGDKTAEFKLDGAPYAFEIADYSENIGAGDSASLERTGYVKPHTPAFAATHRHTAGKDNIANITYMFAYEIDVENVSEITLPDDRTIVIFAAVGSDGREAVCATQLTDARERCADSGVLLDAKYVKTGDVRVSENIEAYCCEFTDENTIKLSGTAKEAGKLYLGLLTMPMYIHANTVMSYKFKAENDNGRNVGIDIEINDGVPLRDRRDANMHPATAKGEVGEWVEVVCPLGKTAYAQRITSITAAYDGGSGDFSAYIKDLKIETVADDLDGAIKAAEEINLDGYGAQSVNEFKTVCMIANSISADDMSTESDRKYAETALRDATAALIAKKDGHAEINACEYDKLTGIFFKRECDGIPHIAEVNNASSATYKAIDFGGDEVDTVTLTYAGERTGSSPQVTVIDGDNGGACLALVSVPETGGWNEFKQVTCKLSHPISGEHDITLNFKGKPAIMMNLRSIKFTRG